MSVFGEDGRKRIEAAIAALERRSGSELVVHSVRASDGYSSVRFAYGFAVALAGASAAHALFPALDFALLGALQVALMLACFFLLQLAPLQRLVLPRHVASHAVHRRAHEEFFARGLFRTRERTAVLIFLSELERQVVILGDEGINARVQMQGWERHVQRIVSAIRHGRAADGVCEVIEELASVLERAVPRAADDQNELSDTVAEER